VPMSQSYCRAYPDEKGIETFDMLFPFGHGQRQDCRAYPDEKGIETGFSIAGTGTRTPFIAEPIPMKRELKPNS